MCGCGGKPNVNGTNICVEPDKDQCFAVRRSLPPNLKHYATFTRNRADFLMRHPFIQTGLLCALLTPTAVRGESVDFNRDIRPIFTKHCTACHGGVKAAGGLSFVSKDGAMALGKSGEHAIIPGDVSKSEILRRIRSTDPEEVMPQPKHGPPLKKAEADLIEQWIREGAAWKNHWAFERPVETRPIVRDTAWPKVSLDHHVLARLEAISLKPSPSASATEWLRRASFDLTGLPPAREDIEPFVREWRTNVDEAKAKATNRMLSSPAFGERWAAVWLDLARYSDTYGFEKDPHRDIWPYRDWVIRAFNADMPFDQFTIDQLAGDLLPNPTADQRLATAFHRNTQTNTEGGTDDEEYRVAAVLDRVNTTWTTWQSTTFGCAQCHDHPYDPLTHKEYYEFMAFFDSSLDYDLDNDFPKMKVANLPADREKASDLERSILSLRGELNAGGAGLVAATDWKHFAADALRAKNGTLANKGSEIIAQGTLPVGNSYEIESPGTSFTAIRLEIRPESDDPLKWPERGSWVSKFEVLRIDSEGKAHPIPMVDVFVDWEDGHENATPQGNVGAFPKIDQPRWAVFVPQTPFTATGNDRIRVVIKQGGRTSGEQATPVRRFSLGITEHADWTQLAGNNERRQHKEELLAKEKALKEITGTMVPVIIQRPQPRDTRVFARGNRLTKEDSVKPGLPKLFTGSDASETADRLAMARWLVGKDNPMAGRVLANRLWGELFGEGIVVSQEDFGSSGQLPSHLELLDHLALRLRDHHQWSIKSMLREMVLSSTYGQTNRASRELVEKDPHNRLLARGPRVRLSAEMVRDQALAASGLLSSKMYGPPVYPPQPAGVWSSVYSGASWKESKGEDRFRRAVYTYSKRTSGFPGFLTFDAPSRDVCSARRIRSNTPLQALVTLNDPAHIEFAQGMAKRMREHASDLPAQLAFGVLLCTQTEASSEMIRELAALHADVKSEYAADPELSARLGSTPDEAALVLVANTILNLDSSLNR
jgi:Protein of unknown function (DUF1549)/Protein of unknown function (DUF1553)/Planctomycete cytochrome C